ncbi:MAG: hypothetical protein ACI304_08925 [Lepagella sp.]
MKRIYKGLFTCAVAGVMAGGMLTSCVDDSYDLSDIDLMVNVGGDLGVPTSSTEQYTISDVLDLSSTSSIKAVGEQYGYAKGDYVLVESGDPTYSNVNIDPQDVKNITCDPTYVKLSLTSPGTNQDVDQTIEGIHSKVKLSDDNIDKQLLSLTRIDANVKLDMELKLTASTGFKGSLTLKPGFTFTYPEGWKIELYDQSMASYCKVEGSKLIFTADKKFNATTGLSVPVRVTSFDFTNVPKGEGLYAPGHFLVNGELLTSGPVMVSTGSTAAGTAINLTMDITPKIPSMTITAVTGKVDPKVDIDNSSFEISDIPDFLAEEDNYLDLADPRIVLNVYNGSPVDINLNAVVEAVTDNGGVRQIGIGDAHSTSQVMVKASSRNKIVLSATGNAVEGATVVKVPGLTELLAKIPDRINIKDVTAKVPSDKEYTISLGSKFSVATGYEAVVPLAFGENLQLSYSTDESGWDEDLSKYNFNEVTAILGVENSIPLEMVPQVQALDVFGHVIEDVTATVEGKVKGGSLASPAISELRITLRSNAENIGRLDGLHLEFKVTSSPEHVGEALNEAQALRFTDIRLKLKGGVTVDAN